MGQDSFIVGENETEIRLDKLIPIHIEGITRSFAAKLIENGLVTVSGKNAGKKDVFAAGTLINIEIPEAEPINAKPQDIPLDIVYEDSDLLVINKPKGMVVHPAPGNPDGTLVNALLAHCGKNGGSLSGINGEIRPGIVHRIDKDTAGLLIVAKNDGTHKKLSEMIKSHDFNREYEAIVVGNIKEDSGTIEKPIGRSKTDRKKMCIRDDGRAARTDFNVLARYGKYTHLRLKLYTGRTHQIRVHMAYTGHPVLGDSVYGKADKLCKGQCLFAKAIGFNHPTSGVYMSFESDLPDWFCEVLKIIKIEK
jgi:23S rRNA pseudouridine1911/1915/1917 synthase